MQQSLLSILIWLPLLAAAICLFVSPSSVTRLKVVPVAVSVLQLVVLSVMINRFLPDGGLQFLERHPWIDLSLGHWGTLRAEYFIGLDGLSLPLVALSVFILLIAAISSLAITTQVKGYVLLFLVINGTIIGTFAAQDLLLFYLFFEFMLLPMFFLIGIWGGPKKEYASIKFFLYTLLGSILILVSFIALYLSFSQPGGEGLIHSFSLQVMLEPMNIVSNSVLDPNNPWTIAGISARHWAFLFLLIGFGIKLPMVPFHTWLPDAHVEAPTPVSVLLAALLLKIGGYGLLRIAYPILPDAAVNFSWVIALIGVISILWGALAAMGSKDLKRLIAYSSVSHMGFVLLGLGSFTTEGLSGAVFQMVSHGLLSAMLFILAGVLYDRTHDRIITHYSGLASKLPLYFTFTIVAFFASMGLPGFSGFIGELFVLLGAFRSAAENDLLPRSFAIIGTLGLVLSAAYILWTLQRMFFGQFYLKGEHSVQVLQDLDGREKTMLLPLALLALLLGIVPQLLLEVINPFTENLVTHIFATLGKLTPNP